LKNLLMRILAAALLPALIFLASCGQPQPWPNELAESNWWLLALKPSWKKFDEDHGPYKRMIPDIDSLQRLAGPETPFSRSRHFEASANYHLFITKDFSAALNSVDSALDCFPSEKVQKQYPRTYVGFLLFAGDLSYRIGKYDQANELYFRAKRISDAWLPVCERSAYTYNVAMVLYRQQNYRQSASYFQEAFRSQASCPDQTGARALQQQEILSNTGLCFLRMGRTDEALSWFDKALAYAEAHRDSLGAISIDKIRGVIAGNKANAYLARHDLTAAEPLLLEGLALNARPGYEVSFAQEVRLDLASLYAETARFAAMDAQLAALRRDLDTLPNPKVDKEWQELIARSARIKGDVGAETRYHKRHEALGDSLENAQRRLLSADLLRQLTEKDLQLQVTMLEQNSRRNTLYLSLLGTAIILALLVIWLIGRSHWRNRKNLANVTELNRHIREQQQALELETARRQQMVMEAVIEAQEAERSVIGLELHDNINQVLTTVKLHNEMAMDGIGDPKAVLQRSTNYLQQCIDEIRGLSKRLSAPTLGKISLCDSVSELVQSINLTGRLDIRNECGALHAVAVRRDVHLAVYRIIQEALNNTLKHSGATEADLVLRIAENGALLLTFTDNGSGFRNGGGNGIGITNMRSRAETLGGTFRIKALRAGGCRIEVLLPDALAES
jgi:signal transduction histidine kinase